MNDSESNRTRCKIIVDAMGGDFAPLNIVVGAVQAVNEISGIELFLIGQSNEIKKVLTQENLTFNEDNIIHTDKVIEMAESPTSALKSKPDSSIVVGAEMVRDGKADAFHQCWQYGCYDGGLNPCYGQDSRCWKADNRSRNAQREWYLLSL